MFPGAAAITAGFLALGLIFYLRRSLRDEEPAPGTVPAPVAEPDPVAPATSARPWHPENRVGTRGPSAPGDTRVEWFELTSQRRQLLVWLAAVGVIGCLFSWSAWVMNEGRRADAARAAEAEARAQRDESNAPIPPILPRPVSPQELGRHEQILETAQKLARAVGASPAPLTAAEDRAVSDVVVALREQHAHLSAVLGDESRAADRARVSALRDRYSALIEQLNDVRAKSRSAEKGGR
ncbi:unnamed protein product [Gemmata massiliana]|uniref:Uncharacterized protein n=1 Tax=Gemmata massiliana TaxID=1210884 RepID=A0A6P2D9W5_9BACT|nr:unnamed protein product [Gemmata massiliana]